MSRSQLPRQMERTGWNRRAARMIGLVAVGCGALGTCLWELRSSGVEGQESASDGVDWRSLPASRGKILDRNGAPLADNRSSLDLYVLPRLFSPVVRADLIELLDLDQAEVAQLDRRLAAANAREADRAVLALEDQSAARQDLVARAQTDLGGAVEIHEGLRRDYPYGELAAHLVGYLDRLGAHELAERPRPGDEATERIGRFGVEEALERTLRGKPGIERFSIDGTGKRVAPDGVEAVAGAAVDAPVPGHDVVLTIDLAVQKLAERAVGDHAAAVVVVEIDTGRILALVSTPSFDPNAMSGPGAAAELERLRGDARQPFLDRTLQEAYRPASTYKLVTAIAGLEAGDVSLDEEVTCTGQRVVGEHVLLDMHEHGRVDFLEALKVSCNVYFWQLGERVGLARMTEVAQDFGFGSPTGLGINGDVAGQVPDPRLSPGADGLMTTLQTAIGAGDVRVTVIQMAMAYAALINGGRLYAPQVVRRVQTSSGEVVEDREPILRRRVNASREALELVRRGMWAAVNARGGTAFVAREGVNKMVGKTGTSPPIERPSEELLSARRPGWHPAFPHAWFVGWAPATRPQILVAVMLEHAGVGGEVAAPVVRQILDDYFTEVAPPPPRKRRH